MLANVFTKTLRDRTLGILVGSVSVGVMLWFGMAVYREIDVSFYYEILPTAVLDLMGIPQGGGAGALSFGAIYDFIGAFVLAGLAVSIGTAAVAGEERAGTMGLLLGNPLSRRRVVLSKTLSMIVVVGVGALIMWAFAILSPIWLDVDMAGVRVGATMLVLFLNGLVYGSLALAVGAWTGSRNVASGAAVSVMIIGYLATSLLPLTGSLADWARLFPWYYFAGSQPAVNGLDKGDVGVLVGLVVLSVAAALVGVVRRDLREKSVDVTVVDRLRANPRTQRIIERIVGSARVSRISVKTTSEFQGVLVITGALMLYMGLIIGPLYGVIPDDFITIIQDFPDALIAMIGGADMSTAAGFIQAEIFSITAPIAIIVLTVVMGSRALAGEEESHTMGLLLGNPITRSRVIVEKAIAMVIFALALGVVTFVGTWLGVLVGGVEDLPVMNIAAVSGHLVLLGLVFGGLALTVGAGMGRSRLASGVAAGVAVASYFMYSFFPLSESFEPWAAVSPFTLYLGSNPLTNGMAWGDATVLAVIFIALVAVSVPLFQRRDLRG